MAFVTNLFNDHYNKYDQKLDHMRDHHHENTHNNKNHNHNSNSIFDGHRNEHGRVNINGRNQGFNSHHGRSGSYRKGGNDLNDRMFNTPEFGKAHNERQGGYGQRNRNNGLKTNFRSQEELMTYMDTDGNGEISKSEIKNMGEAFKESGVESVNINGEDFNVIAEDGKKKVKGGSGNDLIFATDAKKVKGKGGDDIIFAADCKKVKGGSGDDTIVTAGDVKKIKGQGGTDNIQVFGTAKKVKEDRDGFLKKAFHIGVVGAATVGLGALGTWASSSLLSKRGAGKYHSDSIYE